MNYGHETIGLIHLILFLPLYYACQNKAVFGAGIIFMVQFVSLDILVYSLIQGNISQAIKTPLGILIPFFLVYLTKNLEVNFGRKKYNGFKLYKLLIDTDMKYIVMIYILSLIVNVYLYPLPSLYHYANLTVIIALVASMFICKRINKLGKNL